MGFRHRGGIDTSQWTLLPGGPGPECERPRATRRRPVAQSLPWTGWGAGSCAGASFRGSEGAGCLGAYGYVWMYALYWPMHELANNLEALGGRVTVG